MDPSRRPLSFFVFMLCSFGFGTTVDYWTCPALDVPGVVSCTCDAPHGLHCLGVSKEDFSKDSEDEVTILHHIVHILRSLPPENAVNLLELSMQNLTTLPDDLFIDPRLWLHGLIISRSELSILGRGSFRGLQDTLVALGLPGNRLQTIPAAAIGHLSLLEKLVLSQNQIDYIGRAALKNLTLVEDFDLSDNFIEGIEDGALQMLTSLRRLDLSGNRLTPEVLWWSIGSNSLTYLEFISLSRNGIEGAVDAETVRGMPNLRILNLSFNNFTVIRKGSLVEVPGLQTLDLSSNRISVIEENAFSALTKLVQLDLDNNRLKVIFPDSLASLHSLAFLELGHNYLSVIEEGVFADLRSAQLINVRDNDIIHIHQKAFANTSQLRVLDLEDNRLHCDCEMKGFATWLKKHQSLSPEVKRLVLCETPAALEGKPLIGVTLHNLSCSNDTPMETPGVIEPDFALSTVPNSKSEEDDFSSELSSLQVNTTGIGDSLTVWWTISSDRLLESAPIDCVLKISLTAGSRVVAQQSSNCTIRTYTFTDLLTLEQYNVCVSLEVRGTRQRTRCIPVRIATVPSSRDGYVTVLVASLFAVSAVFLLIVVIVTWRRLFANSAKSVGFARRDGTGTHYRILYNGSGTLQGQASENNEVDI